MACCLEVRDRRAPDAAAERYRVPHYVAARPAVLCRGWSIRHEPLPPAELAGFVLVSTALIILIVDGLRSQRRA